jgi:hypothetical protein
VFYNFPSGCAPIWQLYFFQPQANYFAPKDSFTVYGLLFHHTTPHTFWSYSYNNSTWINLTTTGGYVMEIIYTKNSFTFIGKIKELSTFLQNFSTETTVKEILRTALH